MKNLSLKATLIAWLILINAYTAAHATTVHLDLTGQLGAEVLGVHAGFGGASISGYVEFDTTNKQSNGFSSFYDFTAWSVSIIGDSVSHLLEADGEPYDDGALWFDRSADRISIRIDEDIDNPASGAIEDRSLAIYFEPPYDIVSTTTYEELIAAVPNFGSASNFATGSTYQFSTSQAPMSVAAAEIAPVPIPPTMWLFGPAALWLTRLARNKR